MSPWQSLVHRWARPAFWLYAIGLFVGTHLPGADLGDGPIPHPDKVLHVLVFGGWALLFGLSRHAGAPGLARTWLIVWGVASVYATIDESTQAIPVLRRHFSLVDLGANLVGVSAVCGAGWLRGVRTRSPDGAGVAYTPNVSGDTGERSASG